MLLQHKKDLLKEKKHEIVKELISEENELISSVKNIIFWLYDHDHQNTSKCHIIAESKKGLEILHHLDDEIDNKFKGPTKLTNIKYECNIKNPKHLVEFFGIENQIVTNFKDILNHVSQETFSFKKDEIEHVQAHCVNILSELDFNTSELDAIFELIKG